jgi:hypothetical protein
MGVWGRRLQSGGGGMQGFGGGVSTGPAGTYDGASVFGRGGGNPVYYGPSDGNTQKRQFAKVGKANLNLLDPLAGQHDYVPVDAPDEGPFGDIGRYYSASTPGGFFAGVLGAVASLPGQLLGNEELQRAGSGIGSTIGKTIEAPLGIAGGVGLGSIPFVAPVIDQANSAIEENSPYILRDTLKIPTNIGGAFQSALNLMSGLGRIVERTYVGLQDPEGVGGFLSRGALPQDIQDRIDSGELTRDEGFDEAVMSGRGFTDDPMHNMVFSILTDPVNWASLGVGAVAGAVKGSATVARVFAAGARTVGTVNESATFARLASEGSDVGRLVQRVIGGEDIAVNNLSRSELSGMRRVLREDIADRIAKGEDIPNSLKLRLTERMGMSAFVGTSLLGPVAEEATANIVYRAANAIAKASDPMNFFSGSKAGQRSMEQLDMASATGVVAAIKPGVVRDLVGVADDLTGDGGNRIMETIGTWGGNARQEVIADLMAKDAKRVGAVPHLGTANVSESIQQATEAGAYDTNIGKFVETHIEKTKDIRVAALPPLQRAQETVAKLAAILEVDPKVVAQKLKVTADSAGKVDADMAMAVHGMYYYRKGKQLHTSVMDAINTAVQKGTLPADIEPHDLTMVTPRTLTNLRVAALDAALKAKNVGQVRAIIESFDDFNWANGQVLPDSEVITAITDYLNVNRSHLPREIPLLDANGKVRAGLPSELEQWAEDGETFGYGLANGMPAGAPLDAQWRVTHNANGSIRNAKPWLQFQAEGIATPKRLSRWDSARMQMFRGIRGERIIWNQRRRFITDMASTEAGNVALPPALADRIFKSLMFEAQEGRLLPRGMAPEQMMDAVKAVLDDARNHSGQWGNLSGRLTERQVVTGFLRAMEGDVSLVGATQKATGLIKARAPGARSNYWGQLSEKLYPLMRFTLNPIFMGMEMTEPYILNYMRGTPLPLSRTSAKFEQGLASYNAARQFIFLSDGPDGLLAQSAEMNALKVGTAAMAREHFGPQTFFGRIKGVRPDIANRKQAAAGLQYRHLVGQNLKRAFKEMKGDKFDDFWGGLAYEYGSFDDAVIAERWMASNLSLMDKDGRKVGLVMDLMNLKNVGQGRIRLTTDGSRPGDFTFGDVEDLFDSVATQKGLPTRASEGLPPGEALKRDLQAMTEAEFMSMVEDAGMTPRVGAISKSAARDIWRMATGPKVDDFWKGHRDTFLRGLKDPAGRAHITRRLRNEAIDATRAFVQAAARGKSMSEEEFLALHFDDIPKWATDPGTIPPDVLTDIRSDIGRHIMESDPGSTALSIRGIQWYEEAGMLDDPANAMHVTQILVNDIRKGSENREFLYVPVGRRTLENLKHAAKGYGSGVVSTKYSKVGTDPIRAATRYAKDAGWETHDHIVRVSRDEVSATPINPSSNAKRPKSHDFTLDDDLDMFTGMEVYTESGWVPVQEYISRGPVPSPTLREGFTEEPWWDHLFSRDFGTPEPTGVYGLDFKELLTTAEREAIDDYTGTIYGPINSHWRGIPWDPDEWGPMSTERILELSDALDASIKKGVIRERMTLYRGVSYNRAHGYIHDKFDLKVGDIFNDPAYLSMSDDLDTAQDFGGVGGGVSMTFQLPAGFNVSLIEGGEGEHLAGRGIDFEVVARSDTKDSWGGGVIHLTLRPKGEANQTGVRRMVMADPIVQQRNVAIANHLAATDPDALRALVSRAPEDVREGLMEVVEERIARAEAAKPPEGITVLGDGRKFGRISASEGLEDIKAVMDEDDVAEYADAWEDTRARVEYLQETSDSADEAGNRYDPPEVFGNNDTRMLGALAAALPERGGRGALTEYLSTLEMLFTRGTKPTTALALEKDSPQAQRAVLQAQHLLRGLKHPFTTPNVPPHIDDAGDVMLGNTRRRHTGRTDLSEPIVADDAAYEAAGFMTQETADDLGIGATPAPPAEIPKHAMVDVKDLGGSTGALQVRDLDTGKLYVDKQGASEGHITNEFNADAAYEAAGVPVPHATLIGTETYGARVTKRAEMIEGGTSLDDFWRTASAEEKTAMKAQLQQHFALDALLANWDVVGLVGDNIIIKDGIAYRIDNGGALTYRAMGAPKGGAWGPKVSELATLRNHDMNEWAARIFDGISDADIRRQVLDISDKLDAIVAALPPDVGAMVRQRYDDMLDQTAGITPSPAAEIAPTGPAITTRSDLNHAYLVGHYNEMAKLANAEGLGGHMRWTAADMALLAGKAREARGRKATATMGEALDQGMTTLAAEVYFPKGSEGEWMNPVLDLLNRPENAAARHEVMRGVTVNFMQQLRDDFGIIVDGLDDQGIGIWDGANPQPLVPVTIMGTSRRVRDVADIISYGMQQAEVWAYEVAEEADIARAGNWDAYHPRVTVVFADRSGAEQFATNFIKSFPGARGGTAIKMPSGWQVSMIDTEGLLPRLKGSKQVDNDAVKELIADHAEDLADDLDSWVDYGETYVAGPDKLTDGTYDWKGHNAATQRKLAERGASSDWTRLDGLRTAHASRLEYGLGEAAEKNLARAKRGEPITDVLEDKRGGSVFGTTTPTGANAALVRGYGAADALTGIHELIHVFSIAGMDDSMRDVVTKEWEQYAQSVEAHARHLDAKAAAHPNKSAATKFRNQANAARAGLANPSPGAWGKAQEEFFVQLVFDWIDNGVVTSPGMENAVEHFRNWLQLTQKQRATNGLPPIQASPVMQAKLNRMFSRPGLETVPYDIEQEAMRQAARQVAHSSWDEAHATQFYKHDRSMVERTINHPYIGLYPASYMWGKVLPEMVRFLALRPFGMTTPFLGWNVAREIGDTIRTQSETDESFKQFLAENEDAFMFLSMFFPALPQDIPANASLPLRRIAEQGLENEQRYAQGQQGEDVDYTKGAQDAIQYAVGPLGTVRTVSEMLGMGGELLGSARKFVAGEEITPNEEQDFLPVR